MAAEYDDEAELPGRDLRSPGRAGALRVRIISTGSSDMRALRRLAAMILLAARPPPPTGATAGRGATDFRRGGDDEAGHPPRARPARSSLGPALEEAGRGLRRRQPPDDRRAHGRPLRAERQQALACSNGSNAGVITLFATVDKLREARGVTAFLVEPTFRGFSVGKKERKMGIRASPTVAFHLEDCEVPVENRLGREGEGFKIAMRTLDYTRPMTGATAVGVAQAALDAALGYAQERKQFGQPDPGVSGHPVHAG